MLNALSKSPFRHLGVFHPIFGERERDREKEAQKHLVFEYHYIAPSLSVQTAIKMKNFLYFTVLFLINVSFTSSESSEIDTNGADASASDRSLRKERAVLFPSASTIGVS